MSWSRARSPSSCQLGTPAALPADVPESDVDRAERVDDRAAAAGHRRADVQVLPDRRGVERVAAEQHLPQPPIHRVRPGGLDAGAGDPGVQVGLADPDEPLVGLDLDDDRVLRRARGVDVEARIEQNVRADVDDGIARHQTASSRRRSRCWRRSGTRPRPRTGTRTRRRRPRPLRSGRSDAGQAARARTPTVPPSPPSPSREARFGSRRASACWSECHAVRTRPRCGRRAC